MYERRRHPQNAEALLAAKEARKQAEHLASSHAYAATGN
jgi:hypothetical protein